MLGIELSKWNGEWDAAKAKSAGAVFAFIQTSQATTPDPLFSANWSKAGEASLFRGTCHCLDKTRPVKEQADCFLGSLDSDLGELPAAVRIAANDFESEEELALEYLEEFIERIGTAGITPMIATTLSSWLDPEASVLDWTQFPLWVVDYASEATPQLPAPWTRWAFWEFSEKGDGETFGTESFNIHLSTFHGTLRDLLNLVKGGKTQILEERVQHLEQRLHEIDHFVSLLQEPAVAPVPETTAEVEGQRIPQIFAICNANSLNVRNGPGLSHQVIGNLSHNQRVQILEQRGDWAFIQDPQGWICEKYIAIEQR